MLNLMELYNCAARKKLLFGNSNTNLNKLKPKEKKARKLWVWNIMFVIISFIQEIEKELACSLKSNETRIETT